VWTISRARWLTRLNYCEVTAIRFSYLMTMSLLEKY